DTASQSNSGRLSSILLLTVTRAPDHQEFQTRMAGRLLGVPLWVGAGCRHAFLLLVLALLPLTAAASIPALQLDRFSAQEVKPPLAYIVDRDNILDAESI